MEVEDRWKISKWRIGRLTDCEMRLCQWRCVSVLSLSDDFEDGDAEPCFKFVSWSCLKLQTADS
jgi:hypothetical protein